MKFLPLILLTIFSVFGSPVYADYSSTYKSYISLTDYYRQTYQSYQVSKNKYLTYRTLTAQNEALINGRNFLKTRDQLIMQYLLLLTERIKGGGGYETQQLNLLVSQLGVESAWLSTHRTSYDSVSTIPDLQRTSDQSQDRYNSVIRYIALQTAGNILVNKESIMSTSLNDIILRLGEQLKLISDSGSDTSIEQRWLLEAQNKLANSLQKQSDAKSIFDNFHGENIVSDYNRGVFYLTEANQYLREANSYVSEILRIIKGE